MIKNRTALKREWIIIFLVLLGLNVLNSVRLVPYYPHMYLTMITAIILITFLVSQYVSFEKIILRFRKTEKQDQSLNIFFTYFTIIIIIVFSTFSVHIFYQTINDNSLPLDTAKGSGIFIPPTPKRLKRNNRLCPGKHTCK